MSARTGVSLVALLAGAACDSQTVVQLFPQESPSGSNAGVAGAAMTEPDSAEPDPAEPDPAEPDPAKPDAAEPGVPVEPDVVEPDVPVEPDAMEPDVMEPDARDASEPVAFVLPIHRYSYSGLGTIVTDEIGDADGTVMGGAELTGTGNLMLDGIDDFVQLPSGMISSLVNATFMAWVTWSPLPDGSGESACWHRVFSFGDNQVNNPAEAETELFLAAKACGAAERPVAGFQSEAGGLQAYESEMVEFPRGQPQSIALVVDSEQRQIAMYLAGSLVRSATVDVDLSLIVDERALLGESVWEIDSTWAGSFNEFRIYDVALTGAEMAELERLGPDQLEP